MKLLLFLAIALTYSSGLYSQTRDYAPELDFIYGAWSDTIHSDSGDGFFFSPDSCCRFITNGQMTACIIERQNIKVHFRVDYTVTPKQLDIIFLDLKTDSLRVLIPMIFEIIDTNHIKLATNKTNSKERPVDFSQTDDKEIAFLTRSVKNKQ